MFPLLYFHDTIFVAAAAFAYAQLYVSIKVIIHSAGENKGKTLIYTSLSYFGQYLLFFRCVLCWKKLSFFPSLSTARNAIHLILLCNKCSHRDLLDYERRYMCIYTGHSVPKSMLHKIIKFGGTPTFIVVSCALSPHPGPLSPPLSSLLLLSSSVRESCIVCVKCKSYMFRSWLCS